MENNAEAKAINLGALMGAALALILVVIIIILEAAIWPAPTDDAAKLQFALQTGNSKQDVKASWVESGRFLLIDQDDKHAMEFCYTEAFKGPKCFVGFLVETPTPESK